MSLFTNEVKLEVRHGHWSNIYTEAINIAKMLDKSVTFDYNGVSIKLNKHSKPECFVKQYQRGVVAVGNSSN